MIPNKSMILLFRSSAEIHRRKFNFSRSKILSKDLIDIFVWIYWISIRDFVKWFNARIECEVNDLHIYVIVPNIYTFTRTRSIHLQLTTQHLTETRNISSIFTYKSQIIYIFFSNPSISATERKRITAGLPSDLRTKQELLNWYRTTICISLNWLRWIC